MSKKANNGIDNVLPPSMVAMREQVVVDEIKARYWKAQVETMKYHIQYEEILPEYQKLLEKKEEERKEAIQKQQEFLDKLNEVKPEGVSIEPAPADTPLAKEEV